MGGNTGIPELTAIAGTRMVVRDLLLEIER